MAIHRVDRLNPLLDFPNSGRMITKCFDNHTVIFERTNGNEEKGSALSRYGSRTDHLLYLSPLHILAFCLTPS